MTNFTHAKYGPDTVRIDDPTYVVPLLTEDVTVGTGLAFPAADTVAIEAGGVEKARFTSTLNSLAGATTVLANSASAALTVTQTGAGNAFVVEDSASTDSTPFVIDGSGYVVSGSAVALTDGSIQTYKLDAIGSNDFARKNSAGSGIVVVDNTVGNLRFYGFDGTSYIRTAQIFSAVDGTPGTNDMPGRLVFSTTADGASSPTERMRIDSAGNVGVGGTANSRTKLGVQGTYPATSGVGIGIGLLGNVDPSTATAAYYCVYSSPTVAAGTLPELNYNFVAQGVFTGTVASQSAFKVDNTLVGATNNYGFYSTIAAATGRWNFYAVGTAANYFAGDIQLGKTVTAGGTTGAQTINKTVGTVNFAAAATSLVVTNSLVTANSIITATVGTNDTTMKSVAVVAAAGSFTLHANAAATAETRVNFHVFN